MSHLEASVTAVLQVSMWCGVLCRSQLQYQATNDVHCFFRRPSRLCYSVATVRRSVTYVL